MHRGYEPTQDEIRKACAEIQAGWSADEEYHRRFEPHRTLGHTRGWFAPGCGTDSAGVRISPLVISLAD